LILICVDGIVCLVKGYCKSSVSLVCLANCVFHEFYIPYFIMANKWWWWWWSNYS